jgi:alkylhydroperoxidase family enzyme
VAGIARWGDADSGFTPAEQAALSYAERLFVDHANIDREMFDGLQEWFTPEQIVELGWATASYMAYGRLIHSFGLRPVEAN